MSAADFVGRSFPSGGGDARDPGEPLRSSPAEAFFLVDGHGGRRHAVLHRATGPVQALVVHAPAFGIEMNFARRHVADASRALAAAGAEVLVPDFFGSGDSTGEPQQADWAGWAADLTRALQWMRQRHPGLPCWIWAHRAGSLAAAAAWKSLPAVHLLLWQPLRSLPELRAHWERQAAASALGRGEAAADALQGLRTAWQEGRCIDIAGTPVPAGLAGGEVLPLAALAPTPGARMAWVDHTRQPQTGPPTPTQAVLDAWRQAGGTAEWHPLEAPPFWHVAESPLLPALTALTVHAVLGKSACALAASAMAPTPAALLQMATPSAPTAAGVIETAVQFGEPGQCMLGLLATPQHRPVRSTGVVIVAGGAQTRVGANRRFVGLARALAAAGHAVLRFDQRGMGDSEGVHPGFEQAGLDIMAAVDALLAAVPALSGVMLLGLCDGASSSVLTLAQLPSGRVRGLALLNPWVHSETLAARARVSHHYRQRLLDPAWWLRLVRGQVRPAAWKAGALSLWRSRRTGTEPGFVERMAQQLERFDGQVLVVLSARDRTAQEFDQLVAGNPRWTALAADPTWTVVRHADADHTHTGAVAGQQLEADVLAWLIALDTRDSP